MARGRDSRSIFGLRSLDHLVSRLSFPLGQSAQRAANPTKPLIPPAENASALVVGPVIVLAVPSAEAFAAVRDDFHLGAVGED